MSTLLIIDGAFVDGSIFVINLTNNFLKTVSLLNSAEIVDYWFFAIFMKMIRDNNLVSLGVLRHMTYWIIF